MATLAQTSGDAAVITIWSFPSGEALHRVELDRFGTFSHGMPGVPAPALVFDDAGTTLFVRSTVNLKPEDSALWRVEIATGAAESWRVPVKGLIESVVPGPDSVLFLCVAPPYEKTWSAWEWGASAPIVALDGVWGYASVMAGGHLWVTGHERWAYAIDWPRARDGATSPRDDAAIEAEFTRAKPLREARHDELAARARGRWNVDHLQWRRSNEANIGGPADPYGRPCSTSGVRAHLRAEPFPAAQCARLGRGVLVRDGVSLVALDLDRDRVIESRLVEDLQKCVPDGSRMRSVSVGGSVVAVVWDKTLGGGASLVSVLDAQLAALGLA